MPRLKRRFENMPVISVVGLIALVFALVNLVPSLLGIHKQSVTIRQLRQTIRELRRDERLLHKQDARLLKLAKLGEESHAASCSYLADLRTRIRSAGVQIRQSEKFLREHPQGIGGITPTLIRAGIDRQQATRDGLTRTALALSSKLDCSTTPKGSVTK